MDIILLADDETSLVERYDFSLRSEGFKVIHVCDGTGILSSLRKYGRNYFDVILSDTEMIDLDGPEAVKKALDDFLLDDSRTLIMGMSGDSNNQEYWRGIVHHCSFLDKDYIPLEQGVSLIGKKVKQALVNFRSGGLWKEKMPRFY